MKKDINTPGLLLAAFLLVSLINMSAAQWGGSTSSTANALTYRSGSVAIGATSLNGSYGTNDRVFQVTGQTTTGSAFLIMSNGAAGNMSLVYSPNFNYAGLHSQNYPFTFSIGGNERMRLQTNGNIGIGTTTANYKLDVNGTINATGLLVNGVAVNQSQWITSGANINYNTGIVSIGTTTAPTGYKLAIGGKAVAEEIVVKLQTNWPDYVFENDYKLISLQELQLFIAKNKHLPDVPSAKEVEENGISVGQMNVILLKKLEELTLHVIKLEKRLNELEGKKK